MKKYTKAYEQIDPIFYGEKTRDYEGKGGESGESIPSQVVVDVKRGEKLSGAKARLVVHVLNICNTRALDGITNFCLKALMMGRVSKG